MPTENKPAEPKFDLNTSDGGRGFIANLFVTVLRRHDFTTYINERLAADFACTLSKFIACAQARESELQERLNAADQRIDELTSELATGRGQGRAEAAAIIAGLCPEDGINEYVGCSPNGDSGDYSSYWNTDKLRDLLCADQSACERIDRLQGADWMQTHYKFNLKEARIKIDELLRGLLAADLPPPTVSKIEAAIAKNSTMAEYEM